MISDEEFAVNILKVQEIMGWKKTNVPTFCWCLFVCAWCWLWRSLRSTRSHLQ